MHHRITGPLHADYSVLLLFLYMLAM